MKEKLNFEKHEVDWTPEKISRIWDYYISNTSYKNKYFGHIAGNSVAKYLRDKFNLREHKRILDYGCGKGDIINSCMKYMDQDQEIYGLDLSQESVDFVNKRFITNSKYKGAILINDIPSSYSSY